MIRSKKISCILICVLTVLLLSGCVGQKMAVTISGDGTCGYKFTYLYDKSMYDKLKAAASDSDDVVRTEADSVLETGDFSQEIVTINDTMYYEFSREFTFPSMESMQAFLTNNDVYYNTLIANSKNVSAYKKDDYKAPFSSLTLGVDTFIGQLADSAVISKSNNTDSLDLKKYNTIGEYYKALGLVMQISVTLPNAVSESNGVIAGNTVTWMVDNLPDDGKLIAVSGNNPVISSDRIPPVIRGVKNNGLYKKDVTVTASDNVSLASLRLNGKGYATCTYKVKDTGSYTLTAEDTNHNKTTVKFKIDKIKPAIKGVTNGKTYTKAVTLRFSDKNGIKSAKVNGKKVSRKKVTLKKRRAYSVKVTDRAGNVRTVKFRIR